MSSESAWGSARTARTESWAARTLAAPLAWRSAAALVAGLLAFIAATNRWMSWGAALVHAHADDELAYLRMARAAPGLPGERLADQHAQRWPVHWLIGTLADVGGIGVESVYRIAALALAVALLLVLAAVLMRLEASTATGLLCLGVLVLNPYAVRYYALAPGYLADLAFELGLAVALLGLVARRFPLVLAGLAAGTLARQTMLPVLPVIALWVGLAPSWGDALTRRVRAGLVVLLPLAIHLAVDAVASGFSRPSVPFGRLTILDTVAALPDTAGDLVNHAAHTAIGLLAITALLAVTLWQTRPRELPAMFWGTLGIGLAIVAQAAALNPDPIFNDYDSTNEPRLTALALPALVVALAVARKAVERAPGRRLGEAPAIALLAVAALAVGSLHHVYTSISTGSRTITLALQLGVALVLMVALARLRRTPRYRTG